MTKLLHGAHTRLPMGRRINFWQFFSIILLLTITASLSVSKESKASHKIEDNLEIGQIKTSTNDHLKKNALIQNSVPTLSSPRITPSAGSVETVFRFQIIYTDLDNESASPLNIYIDNTPFVMVQTFWDSDYTDGADYIWGTTLTEGVHQYYFVAFDGSGGSTRSPLSGHYSTQYITAPQTPPILENGNVSPSSAQEDQEFLFTVVYKDMDNSTPEYVRVMINEEAYDMLPNWSSAADFFEGVAFSYRTFLSPANYSYYFVAQDDIGETRLPESGQYVGPIVSAVPPSSLVGGKVVPLEGKICSSFTFSVNYRSEKNWPPEEIWVVLGGNRFSMEQANTTDTDYKDGAIFIVEIDICSAGVHEFYFETSNRYAITKAPENEALQVRVQPFASYSVEDSRNSIDTRNDDVDGFTWLALIPLPLAILIRRK